MTAFSSRRSRIAKPRRLLVRQSGGTDRAKSCVATPRSWSRQRSPRVGQTHSRIVRRASMQVKREFGAVARTISCKAGSCCSHMSVRRIHRTLIELSFSRSFLRHGVIHRRSDLDDTRRRIRYFHDQWSAHLPDSDLCIWAANLVSRWASGRHDGQRSGVGDVPSGGWTRGTGRGNDAAFPGCEHCLARANERNVCVHRRDGQARDNPGSRFRWQSARVADAAMVNLGLGS